MFKTFTIFYYNVFDLCNTVIDLIALTNAMDGAIDGLIMCPGEELGKSFTYVAEKSFKCQRSIPMSFFEEFKGQVVFNP